MLFCLLQSWIYKTWPLAEVNTSDSKTSGHNTKANCLQEHLQKYILTETVDS